MIKRFTASLAQKEVELAERKALEEIRINEEEKKRNLKKKKALLNGWKKQKELILKAAMDGEHELTLSSTIFYFKKLLDLGFKVVEVGRVLNQNIDAEKIELLSNLKKLENLPYQLLEKFIDNNQKILQPIYGSKKFMYSSLSGALDESIQSKSSIFDGDAIVWSSLKKKDLAILKPEFDEITKSIIGYKKYHSEMQSGLHDIPEYVVGRYNYSYEDSSVGELKLNDIGNLFKISWNKNTQNEYCNKVLFSAEGSAWVASIHGQHLFGKIFTLIKFSSSKGLRAINLNFEFFEKFWRYKEQFSISSCHPEEIANLLEYEGFRVNKKLPTANEFILEISW
jgi:hypothetical protein